MGVSNVSNISERLTLVELTQWCALNTQPLYPIGLILMPLGLLFSLLVSQTCVPRLTFGWNILHGKATIPATTYYVQFSRNNYRNIVPCQILNLPTICLTVSFVGRPYPKAIHPSSTHWAMLCTFLEEGVLSPKFDRRWLNFIVINSHSLL